MIDTSGYMAVICNRWIDDRWRMCSKQGLHVNASLAVFNALPDAIRNIGGAQ